MKNQVNNTTTATATTIYETAEKAVYIALKARHQSSGQKLFEDLLNAQRVDQLARKSAELFDQVADKERKIKELRADLKLLKSTFFDLNKHAHNLKIAPQKRADYQTQADETAQAIALLQDQIKRTQAEARELNKILDKSVETNFTDRADLTQSAKLQEQFNTKEPQPIDADLLASYGVDTIEDLTETEREDAQNRANFHAVINAASREIGRTASPDALNSTTTIKTQATAEQVEQWARQYEGVGALITTKDGKRKEYTLKQWATDRADGTRKPYKLPVRAKRCRASDCFDTLEYINNKTEQGWYIVRHYVTVAPYQYIGEYTEDENGETDIAYIKTYNPFIDDQQDFTDLDELTKALTPQEREIFRKFAEHYRYTDNKRECMLWAYKQVGITAESTAYRKWKKIEKALEKRAKELHIIKTK